MKLFTTTALALTLAAGTALAQDTTMTDETTMTQEMPADTMASADTMDNQSWDRAELIRTRDITGGVIYTTANSEGWDMDAEFDNINENWTEIGEIEDIVLSRDGQVIGIVAEVGGFLDIGDKHVMLEVSDLNLVAVDDRTYAYVTRYSEEELENLASVDEGFWD